MYNVCKMLRLIIKKTHTHYSQNICQCICIVFNLIYRVSLYYHNYNKYNSIRLLYTVLLTWFQEVPADFRFYWPMGLQLNR